MGFFQSIKEREMASSLFDAMKPADRKKAIDNLFEGAMEAFENGKRDGRNGQTQGSAFLWVDLYGKSSIDRAFRKKVSASSDRKIFQNYRGAKNAWYFGSQSNLGYYDGLVAMTKFLGQNGVSASQGDEWD